MSLYKDIDVTEVPREVIEDEVRERVAAVEQRLGEEVNLSATSKAKLKKGHTNLERFLRASLVESQLRIKELEAVTKSQKLQEKVLLKQKEVLLRNIAVLYKTATTELKRKTEEIGTFVIPCTCAGASLVNFFSLLKIASWVGGRGCEYSCGLVTFTFTFLNRWEMTSQGDYVQTMKVFKPV